MSQLEVLIALTIQSVPICRLTKFIGVNPSIRYNFAIQERHILLMRAFSTYVFIIIIKVIKMIFIHECKVETILMSEEVMMYFYKHSTK